MPEPFDIPRIEAVLASPRVWIEFAAVAACIGFAWFFDRALQRRAQSRENVGHARLRDSFSRIIFPLTALLLLVVARIALRHLGWRTILIDIAMPLLLALAAIRMAVYAMRRLFAAQDWLKTGERAIAFSIWGVAILYFTGVLPDLAAELDAIRIPICKSQISLLTLR